MKKLEDEKQDIDAKISKYEEAETALAEAKERYEKERDEKAPLMAEIEALQEKKKSLRNEVQALLGRTGFASRQGERLKQKVDELTD